MAKILLAEDERAISDIVKFNLERNKYEVDTAYDGIECLEKFKKENYDLVLLDIMMPSKDGYKCCEEIRKISNVPIIMLTALEEEADKVKGFEMGIDDYVIKPFSNIELICRIKANIKRNIESLIQKEDIKDVVAERKELKEFGLVVENATKTVQRYGKPIDLSITEYEVLWFLVSNMNRTITREELTEEVWKTNFYDNRTVDVTVHRLRQKIQVKGKPEVIYTRRGVGYYIPSLEEV